MRHDTKRATVAQSTQNCRDARPRHVCENDHVVDCCVFCLCPPPDRPPMREKISSGVVVFLAKLCPHQTHVVLGIFELRLRCHISTGRVSRCVAFAQNCSRLSHPCSFQRFLGAKVGRTLNFAFSHASPRVENTVDGRANCYFSRVEWLT